MSDYIEYGEDWEKQMMRLSKKELIIFFRQNVSRISHLESSLERLGDSEPFDTEPTDNQAQHYSNQDDARIFYAQEALK